MESEYSNTSANIASLNNIFIQRIYALSGKIESFFTTGSEDDLHDSRVNARRLQTLFKSFGHIAAGAEYNEYAAMTGGLIKSFGKSRELDVCAAMTSEYADIVKFKDSLLSGFQQDIYRQIKKERKKLSESELLRKFPEDAKCMKEHFKSDSVFPADTDTLVVFGGAILNQLETVTSLTEKISAGHCSKKTLHKIRIKSKPLRYNMETVSEYYRAGIKPLYDTVKKFVECAGLIHDADVILERLKNYRDSSGKNHALGKSSIRKFSGYLRTLRESEFEKIKILTDKIRAGEFRDKIKNSIFENNYE